MCFWGSLIYLIAPIKLQAQGSFTLSNYVHSNGDTGTLWLSLSEPLTPSSQSELLPEKQLWNGPYRFESKQEQREPQWRNRTYIETGYYTNGQKSGEWRYVESVSTLKIRRLNPTNLDYQISHVLRTQKGFWKKGVRHGKWTLETVSNPLENKVPIEFVEYQFENGWLNGPLRYENQQDLVRISGMVNEGLMVGDWNFQWSDSVQEHRLYEKGVLISLERKSTADTQNWQFPLSSRCIDALKSREKTGDLIHYPMSLTFSDGYPKHSQWIRAQQMGGVELQRLQRCMSWFLTDWLTETGQFFGTNRCIYPLSALEESQLSEWLENRELWSKKIRELNDSLVQLGRFPAYENTVQHFKQWIRIQEKRLKYTETWREIMETGRLVYYNRDGEILTFAKELLHADTLHFAKGFALITYPESQSSLIAYLVENTQKRIETANLFLDSVLNIQKRYELSRFMLNLSANIQQTHDSLWRTCRLDTNTLGKFYLYIRDFRSNFLGEAFERRYQSFLNAKDLEIEQAKGDSLLRELEQLQQLRYRALYLAKLWRAIDTFYTENRVDAFTFERLKVRTKKRLFDQLSKFIEEEIGIHANQTLQERLASTQRIREIFQTFLYLRDRNTSVLERKLGKSKSYEERRKLWESS